MITFLSSISDAIGIIGVILLLMAFFLLNTNKLLPAHLSYQALNFVGAGFILFSLLFQWNLPAVLIEIAWMLISLIGIVRSLQQS
jgi:hypothetical protein